jgi:hypothetical protein
MNKSLHFNNFATPMTTKVFKNTYKIEAKDLEEFIIPMQVPAPKEDKPAPLSQDVVVPKTNVDSAVPNTDSDMAVMIGSDSPRVSGNNVGVGYSLLADVLKKEKTSSPKTQLFPLIPPKKMDHPNTIVLGMQKSDLHQTENLVAVDLLAADVQNLVQRLGNDEHEWEKLKGAVGRVTLHISSVEKAIELQRIGNNDDLKEMTDRVTNAMQSIESRTKQYSDKRLADEVQQLDYKITVMNKKLQKDSCLTNLTGSLLGLVCIACLYQFFYMLFFKNMLKVDELQQFYTA